MTFTKLVLSAALLALATAPAAGELRVVASIKPVHSLVAAIMRGAGEPDLIVQGAESPHDFVLKPSRARELEKAGLVFWIGPELETFLEKPVLTIAARARSVALIDTPGLTRHELREGGAFDHDPHEASGARHSSDHHTHDAHIWLDPENAKRMAGRIRQELANADPVNAHIYEENMRALSAAIDTLASEIAGTLEPLAGKSYVVFHDGYQYFERRFGIAASGSITVNPETMPGAGRISEIRASIAESGVTCVFTEPQFPPKLAEVVIEGTAARSAVLDPLGAGIEDGPDLYLQLMRAMAKSLRDCLDSGG